MLAARLRSRQAAEVAVVVGLAALWGINYVLIGLIVEQLDAAFMSAVRALVGGLVLVAWRPRALLSAWALARQHPLTMIGLAVVAVAAPIWLIGAAQHEGVSAGAAAVVIALSPALIAVLAPLVDDSERLSRLQWIGAAVATLGVAVVVGSTAAQLGSVLGLVAIATATAAYAIGSILAKLRCEGWPAAELAIGSLLLGGLLLVAPALGRLPHAVPSASVIVALALLSVVGTGMSFLFLYWAIKFGGAGFSLRPVYLSPAFSVAGGALLLGQPATSGLLIGFAVTCVGVALSTTSLKGVDEYAV